MKTPYIQIDLIKLQQNLEAVRNLCHSSHAQLTPVSKVVMGPPRITSLYAKQTHSIGDSRIIDILRMHSSGVKGRFLLVRTPALSEAEDVMRLADISMQSDLQVLQAINDEAVKLKTAHQIIVMIEMGDLREGILQDQLENFLRATLTMKGIDVLGIGTNATCFAGLIPTPENLSFLYPAKALFKKLFHRDPLVSGGGSNLVPLMINHTLPDCINHVRMGESIVMGVDAIKGLPVPGTHQDCFKLYGEIIESIIKPSSIKGPLAHNAFGEHPVFQNKGLRRRALVNIGRLDTDIRQITPTQPGISILGASSDHLVLDIEEADKLNVGDILEFNLTYSSLLFAMNSPYVEKVFI